MRDKLVKKEISLLKDLLVKLERYGRNAYIFNNHVFNVEKNEQIGYASEELLVIIDGTWEDIMKDICPDGFYYIEDITACKEYLSKLIKEKVQEVEIAPVLLFFKMVDDEENVKKLYDETTRQFLSINYWESFIKYEEDINRIINESEYALIKDDAGKYPSITLTKSQLTNVTKTTINSIHKHIVPIQDGLYKFNLLLDIGELRAYTAFYYVDCDWE